MFKSSCFKVFEVRVSNDSEFSVKTVGVLNVTKVGVRIFQKLVF